MKIRITQRSVQTFKIILFVSILACLFQGTAFAEKMNKPFNRIVIEVDASGSYKGRQSEALAKAKVLLDSMARRELTRWEKGDEVVIISLDAIPEVIWQGSPQALGEINPAAWVKRFGGRTDYANCTDIESGFKLAAREFNSEPIPAKKYLFIFSDLIHEPPLASPSICQKPQSPSLPAKDFSWDQFADVSVSVFWVPPVQKLGWSRIVAENGLSENFKLYSNSESAEVEILPPPVARKQVSELEKREIKENLSNGFSLIVKYAFFAFLALAGVFVMFFIIMLLVRRLFSRNPTRSNRSLPRPGTVSPPQSGTGQNRRPSSNNR
jgi:hypothetical protein